MCAHSSVQLLEPFRHSHYIQLISSCTGIVSGNTAVGDMERAPEIPANGMKSNLSLATLVIQMILQDSIRRWSKSIINCITNVICYTLIIRLTTYCLNECIVSTDQACSERVTKYMLHIYHM